MFQTYNYYPGLPLDSSRNMSWTPNNGGGNNGNAPVIDYSTAYHTFGVDWQPDHLTFYIDSMASGTFPTPGTNNANIPRTAGYILIQQMVENSWCRQPMFACTLSNAATSTDTFRIDYVRVWQGTSPADNRTKNAGVRQFPNSGSNSNAIRGQTAFAVKGVGQKRITAVTIYNEQGRLIRRLNGSDIVWNGANAQGDNVKPGLYLYVVDCGGMSQRGTILRVQ